MIVARTLVSGVTTHLRYRLCEWVFAAILATFSFRLLSAGSTFDASPGSYAFMAHFATEDHWGYVIGSVATLRMLALGINGSVRAFAPYSPLVRACTALFSAAVWFCLSFGFLMSNPVGTGWGTYGVLLIADIGLAVLIAGEAGPVLRKHWNGP